MIKKETLFTLVLIFLIAGCATVPTGPSYSTYDINGTAYMSLAQLCSARGIDWQYDIFTQTITLKKDTHRINMWAGDKLVLVDGQAERLSYPVDIYNGIVVVPYSFKGQVIDSLFRQEYTLSRGVSPALNIRKVVVDAGHGGNDPGAIGRSGLREKDVNLDIAKRLTNLLQKRGVEVIMTRSRDIFIPLDTRVMIANNSGADLFISIHSNASRARSLNGFEVYYVSSTVSDSKRALTAAENASLYLTDASFSGNSANVKAIVWDMIYTANRAESVELARSICRTMDKNGTKVLGVKAARFEVLRGTRSPAVLIEVGFLSNFDEERMLRNSYSRERIAETIMQGIEEYSETCALTAVAKKR